MPNNIQLAKNYINNLDEVYRLASVTSDLTSDATMCKAGANANEIIYPQITVTGLGDYNRNSGYTSGAVDLQWKTAAFNYDRGTKISVDVMDNEESRNLAFGMAGAELCVRKQHRKQMHLHLLRLQPWMESLRRQGSLAEHQTF